MLLQKLNKIVETDDTDEIQRYIVLGFEEITLQPKEETRRGRPPKEETI